MARAEGITEAQLRALSDHDSSDAFSPLEKQVLDYADALTRTPARVTDEQLTALRKHLDDEQLVELTAMIGWENFRARFSGASTSATRATRRGRIAPYPSDMQSVEPLASRNSAGIEIPQAVADSGSFMAHSGTRS